MSFFDKLANWNKKLWDAYYDYAGSLKDDASAMEFLDAADSYLTKILKWIGKLDNKPLVEAIYIIVSAIEVKATEIANNTQLSSDVRDRALIVATKAGMAKKKLESLGYDLSKVPTRLEELLGGEIPKSLPPFMQPTPES